MEVNFKLWIFYQKNFEKDFYTCGYTALLNLPAEFQTVEYKKNYKTDQLRKGEELELLAENSIMEELS